MDIAMAFATGLLSSMHCVGMCGPLVLAYTTAHGGGPSMSSRIVGAHLAYNGGRVLAYGCVGALLGFVGGTVGALRDIGFWFSGIVGVATMLFGWSTLRRGFGTWTAAAESDGAGSFRLTSRLSSLYRRSFGALVSRPTLEARFYIGLLTPLLPCGLLYGMLIRSMGAPSPWEGAMMMLAFGSGIVPALLATGLLASVLSHRVRAWGEKLAAVMLIAMGASLVWRAIAAGLGTSGHGMHM